MATKQAEAYKLKGNAAFKKGDHALAIEMYTYATELDPNNPVFFTNRSNAYYLMKNWAKSERDARKAIKASASWEKGHYRLGMALLAQDNAKDALDAFKKACDIAPSNATFSKALAEAKASMMKGMTAAAVLKLEGNEAFKAGRIEEAVKIYGRAIDCSKNTDSDKKIKVDCLANRAACFRQLYLPDQCIEDCTQALDMEIEGALLQKVLIRRAQAYESMEKYKQALEDFTKCCRLNPNAKIAFDGANRLRTAMKKLGMM